MTQDEPYDLLVVGGGTAGLVAAQTARGLGARVLLVERDRTGGDCLWTGCVPSKALLTAASAAATARGSGRLGVHTDGVRVDFAQVRAHVQAAVAHIAPVDSVETLRRGGVEVLEGDLVLTGRAGAQVGETAVTFRSAVLATGAAPVLPEVPGLAQAAPLTSETVWDLAALPARLAVLGGGNIACELGQAFARLGSAVTVVERGPRLLSRADPRASALLEQALRADGVDVRTQADVTAVEPAARGSGTLRLADGTGIAYDRLLVAVGRAPRTPGLGLAAAGVAVDARGFVQVDARLRTTNPRVWAAGDLTGHPQYTHTAGVHGSVAAANAVLGLRRAAPLVQPRVTFTDPEVASVGVGVIQAQERADLRVVTVEHTHVDRAVATGDTTGYSSLVVDGRSRVVGAVVVGPRAGESIAEMTVAVQRGLTAGQLAGVTHPYPTWSDGVWNAAIADHRRSLGAPRSARAVGALLRARRRWLDVGGR